VGRLKLAKKMSLAADSTEQSVSQSFSFQWALSFSRPAFPWQLRSAPLWRTGSAKSLIDSRHVTGASAPCSLLLAPAAPRHSQPGEAQAQALVAVPGAVNMARFTQL